MNPLYVVLIILVAVAYPVAMFVARNACLGKVGRLLDAERYDETLAYLDRRGVRYVFSPYNIGVMRFNTLQMKGDIKGAERELETLIAQRFPKAQQADLAERAFRFYLEQGRTGKAHSALRQVHECCDAVTAKRCEQMWEIFAKGSSAYIDEMSEAYEGARGEERSQLALLVANQYANRHDGRNAAAWRAKAAV